MVNTKEIIKRIGSVKNTKKITKAMEMIAAVKMRKSVQTASSTKEYSTIASEILQKLGSLDISHPLSGKVENQNDEVNTDEPKRSRKLLILITSNRGLCGSYNSKVIKKATEFISRNNSFEYLVLAIGNKAAQFAKRNNLELIALYDKLTDNPNYGEILPIAKTIMNDYLEAKYTEVDIIYTNYISGLVQKVTSKQILPIKAETLEEFRDLAGTDSTNNSTKGSDEASESAINQNSVVEEYDFEPKQKELLDYLLPMLVEIQLYQAILESAASEHSSRMIAMKNATDSAGEMIDSLTLEYNKGRQAAITQEIAEIVSGANAQE